MPTSLPFVFQHRGAIHETHDTAASQWMCRAPDRDAGKAKSYQPKKHDMKSRLVSPAAPAAASNETLAILSVRPRLSAAFFLLVSGLLCATSYALNPPTSVSSAQAAAKEVHRQAQIAAGEFPEDPNASKSYGVGVAIVENATGRVVHAWGNRVNGQLKSGMWFASLDPSAQGSLTTTVTAGSRTPTAILPTGEPLTLTWLSLRGGTATAEFSIAPRDVLGETNKAALLPYLGKTWTVS